jgi:predicted metal-binding membrane protein
MDSSRTCIFQRTVSSAPDLASRILRHERAIVAGGIGLLLSLSCWYLALGAGVGGSMAAMQPPLTVLILMWWVMMAAMMLPSAAPAILLYARVRQARKSDSAIAGPWSFLAGYVAMWLLFSIVAATAQRLLAGGAMTLRNPAEQSFLLIASGVYQLSPLKGACLRQCRSPAQFITRHWRPGWNGAFRLGLLHGAYCVGCCWLLMALLFVGGVMNFICIAALAAVVAVEKLAPLGAWIGRAVGAALIAWGAVRLLA